MSIVFTQDEKEKIRDTLCKVVTDLREIYDISHEDVINYDFSTMENGKKYDYCLVVKAKESFMYLRYCDWYMQLDKKIGKKYHPGKIKDYTTAYEFLKQYDTIRKDLLLTARKNQQKKDIGMTKIDELNSKYTKEATIEVELPETVNQSNIELIQEDGKNVGRINIGPVSIKILSSPSVKIITSKNQEKVKRK